MTLPEPVAWRLKDKDASSHHDKQIYVYYDISDIRTEHPDAVKVTSALEALFTEAQLREALAQQETAMRQVLELLGPQAPECCGCRAEWDMAIDVLESALK